MASRPLMPTPTTHPAPRSSESLSPPPAPAPRLGHKKSRKGCAQCKRRHVKCDEGAPCSNCVRHGVACSRAGGPYVTRDDAKGRRPSGSSSAASATGRATRPDQASDAQSAKFRPSRSRPDARQRSATDAASPFMQDEQQRALDLQLMHHYMAYTNAVMTNHRPEEAILAIWQIETPKVAFQYEYVLHAVLAFTAFHKLYMDPGTSHQHLRHSAVQHLDHAFTLHRSNTDPVSEENADARFLFPLLVTLASFAVLPNIPPIDGMVELLTLVKEVDSSMAETWFWVAQGPFAPILLRGFQEAIPVRSEGSILPPGMDFGLGHLDFMLGVDTMLPDERRTCYLVLAEMKKVYDQVVTGREMCSVATILCFPKQGSSNFCELLKKRVPQALVILTYYAVLINVLDDRWWMGGWPKRLLQDVVRELEAQWHQWIEWPMQCILTRDETMSA